MPRHRGREDSQDEVEGNVSILSLSKYHPASRRVKESSEEDFWDELQSAMTRMDATPPTT